MFPALTLGERSDPACNFAGSKEGRKEGRMEGRRGEARLGEARRGEERNEEKGTRRSNRRRVALRLFFVRRTRIGDDQLKLTAGRPSLKR